METSPMTQTPEDRENRTHVLRFRVSEAEREAIQTRAQKAGLSVSEYSRRVCLSGKVTINRKADNAEAVRLLLIAGNNLNQIARHLNKGGASSGHAVSEALSDIRSAVEGLVR